MEPRSLTRPVLCLVTPGDSHPDLDTIRIAARAGVDLIQVREPQLGDRSLLAVVRRAMDAVAGTGTRVVVNDRLDVALAAGAGGVHLRGDSMAAPDVRALAPAWFLVGRSVHAESEAIETERRGGCDYLVFGTVFDSASKPGHLAAGVEALARVCAGVGLPVLAIGGVTTRNVGRIVEAGAAGIAAIRLFDGRQDVAAAVRAVRRAFDTCYPHPK